MRQTLTIPEREKNFKTLVSNQKEKGEQKLRIKQSQKNEIVEKIAPNKNGPISKVIVVKKCKIRQFMKAKKKELQH